MISALKRMPAYSDRTNGQEEYYDKKICVLFYFEADNVPACFCERKRELAVVALA